MPADHLASQNPQGPLLHCHQSGVEEILCFSGVVADTIVHPIFDFQGRRVKEKKFNSSFSRGVHRLGESLSVLDCVVTIIRGKSHSLAIIGDRILLRSLDNSLPHHVAEDVEDESAGPVSGRSSIVDPLSLAGQTGETGTTLAVRCLDIAHCSTP